MKKFLLAIILCSPLFLKAQVICIYCYDQNDSISQNVNNLLLNGGMETGCGHIGFFCPLSSNYGCDIDNWICTGGGTGTYANVRNAGAGFMVAEGMFIAYFGNSFCNICSPVSGDTSCLVSNDCTVEPLPVGYPENGIAFGGTTGISLQQTVTGLTVNATYVLEFWAGGEGNFIDEGLFGVDVGFGDTLLRNPHTPQGAIGRRFIIEFNAVSTSHTIKFTNWGHICTSCTELTLDDVRLYTLAELNPAVPACSILPIVAFTAPNDICPGTCTSFLNLTQNATSYQWFFPGGAPSVSTDPSPQNICYSTTGNYDVMLIATNSSGSDTLMLSNYINVYPSPAPQGILQSGDTLFANPGATSYGWYLNGSIISGATDYFYVASVSGDYNVVATDGNGCEVEAVIFNVFASVESAGSPEVIIHQNPVVNTLSVRVKNRSITALTIFNPLGEKVMSAAGSAALEMDVQALPPGIYVLEVNIQEKILHSKFVRSGF